MLSKDQQLCATPAILVFISGLKLGYVSVQLKSIYFIAGNRNEVCKYILDEI
jgi:hypothetical protein